MNAELTMEEVCEYFEALPEERRQLVWVRCGRQLPEDIEDMEPDDPLMDEVFHRVLTDMWVQDQFDKLVALGVLSVALGDGGRLTYRSC